MGALVFLQMGCTPKESTTSSTATATPPTVQPEVLKPTAAILEDISVKKFLELKGSMAGLQILDVRTPAETAEGIVAGATLINVNDPDFAQQVEKLDKEKPVAVYCRSGSRSRRAQATMNNLGFKEIYNVDGGFEAWKAAGYESVKP